MQVQLKQQEIEAAITGYIAQQGININGKQIAILFTAGRKNSGLSADITLDDIEVPQYSGKCDTGADSSKAPIGMLKREVEGETQARVEEDQAEVVKTSSLFG